eukprot:TRINITY_DN13536_c0_g1_i2.p1 TRINITY_DN13536_c0_g1~~TRINITY_DN13536_c0_g1_i2.p1  ORF type:complete len:412 (-),score=133.37 TRINITY_DN13536_c0_g1_i2:250-1419(-)
MAPKKGAKRTQEAAQVSPEVEQRKKLQAVLRQRGVSKDTYAGVVDAINHPLAGDLNADTRKMLVATVAQGLCVPLGEREEVQEISVRMLDQVFECIMGKMRAEIDTATAALDSEDSKKAQLQKEVAQADAALEEASTKVSESKNQLAEATKATMDAKAALAQIETEQKDAEAQHRQAKEDKEAIEAALTVDFRILRDGEVDADQAKQHYEKLAALVGKLKLDSSLLTALPTCMMKKPSERGSFDAMVVTTLEEGLKDEVAKLAESIEAGEPEAAARRQAAESANHALEAAKKTQQELADLLNTNTELKQEREKDKQAALAALSSHEPEVKAASQAKVEKEAQLQSFKDWNHACFKLLRDAQAAPAQTAKTAETNQESVLDPALAFEAGA